MDASKGRIMKVWQWASIMWILCTICYYVGDKQDIKPLIASSLFAVLAGIALLVESYNNGK